MKKMKRLLSLFLAIIMVMGVCSVGAFAVAPTVTVAAKAENSTTIKPGETTELEATLSGATADTETAVLWQVVGANCISVNNGVVTGISPGTSTVQAVVTDTDGNTYAGTVSITVSEVAPISITLATTEATIAVGGTFVPVVASWVPTNTTQKTLTLTRVNSDGTDYTGSDSVITISGTTVTGGAEGDAYVKVSAGEAYQMVTLHVEPSVTITFNKNSDAAEGTMTAQNVIAGQATTLKTNTFTNAGKVFKGWGTTAGATTAVYVNGGSITVTEDTTLYAVWGEPTASLLTTSVNAGSTVTIAQSGLLAVKPAAVDAANVDSIVFGTYTTTNGTLKLGGNAWSASNNTVYKGSSDFVTASGGSTAKAVTFTANANATAGTVTIPYTAKNSSGADLYTGSITITIQNKNITKTASASSPATFTAADFAVTGKTLSYVTFNMSTGYAYYYGSLACTYPSAMTQTGYNYTVASTYLPYVTYTPNSYATANASIQIPYTATYSDASTVTGTIVITIQNSTVVAYTTPVNTPVAFKGTDFATALLGTTYANYAGYLTNITFDTYSKGAYLYGTLASSYFSTTGSSGLYSYYKTLASGTYLDYVTFTPSTTAVAGTVVEIPFTAYYSTTAITGSVKITIGATGAVEFTTNVNTPVTLSATPFNATGVAPTGYYLSYVQFTTLPSSYYGTLYYNYNTTTKTGTAVTANTAYYGTTTTSLYMNSLAGVTFVPTAYMTNGTSVSVPYTAVYTNGLLTQTVTGTMTIKVGTTSSVVISYTPAASATSVTFYANDFATACNRALGTTTTAGVVTGTSTLSYVQFTLPTYGTLYYKASTASTPVAVKATDKFYYNPGVGQMGISGVYYSYQGFAPKTITYTGVDTLNRSYVGTVKVTPKTYFDAAKYTYTTSTFKDISENEWYGVNKQGTVKAVYQMGLMKGDDQKKFNPNGNITIAEALTMAARLNSIYNGGTGTFTQAAGNDWYKVYVNYCISKGIIRSTDFTNYNAKATRAQIAYIFANAVPTYELVAINNVTIPDVKATDTYATYIYRLYNAGVLTGYQDTVGYVDGTFAASSNIKRAEVASIIMRLALPSERETLSF